MFLKPIVQPKVKVVDTTVAISELVMEPFKIDHFLRHPETSYRQASLAYEDILGKRVCHQAEHPHCRSMGVAVFASWTYSKPLQNFFSPH